MAASFASSAYVPLFATDDLLLTEQGIEYLGSDFERQFEELLRSSEFRLWRLPTDVGVGLGVVDGREAWFGVYCDDGRIRGSFATDAADAVEYAASTIAACRTESQQVSPSLVNR